MTLMFRMVEFEHQSFAAYARAHQDQWRGVHGLWDLVQRATRAGELDLPREDVLFFATPHPREVSVNSTRVSGARGIDVWDLTRAECEGRRQFRQIVAFLQKYVPGFASAYGAQTGVQIGVRETRRVAGAYQLTADDIVSARKHPDVVARGAYPIDIHDPTGKGTVLTRLPPGEAYDIPLRCLLPQRIANLLVAGRCISGTHEAHSSYRVMPISMATGHAAGVCAALAASRGCATPDVPAADVQHELLRQGADLGSSSDIRQGVALPLVDAQLGRRTGELRRYEHRSPLACNRLGDAFAQNGGTRRACREMQIRIGRTLSRAAEMRL